MDRSSSWINTGHSVEYIPPSRVARMAAPNPRPPPGSTAEAVATARRAEHGTGGSILPVLPTASPNASKRSSWTTPRLHDDEIHHSISEIIAPPPRRAETASMAATRIADLSRQHVESDGLFASETEQAQLVYMEQMYGTINLLNAELESERRSRGALEVAAAARPSTYPAISDYSSLERDVQIPMGEFTEPPTGFIVSQTPVAPSYSPRRLRTMPSPPSQPPQSQHRVARPPVSPRSIVKDQDDELCTTLGTNAELRIRSRDMERTVEKTELELELARKQMKMTERRAENREEKLRALLKEKLNWQKELKATRAQVVEEKMRQVDLFRDVEAAKRHFAAELESVEQELRATQEENAQLRTLSGELKTQLNFQARKLDEMVRQAQDEKARFVVMIEETRHRFREWKEGEAQVLAAAHDQAVRTLKTEYELKMERHQDEKQKLRDKVNDLEVSIRLLQKNRALSPLELSLRKTAIMGSKDQTGTIEAAQIETQCRVLELETLLAHSQEYQARQESLLKLSEATISRLMQEREVTALETLSLHPFGVEPQRSDVLLYDTGYVTAPSSPARRMSSRGSPSRSPRYPVKSNEFPTARSPKVKAQAGPSSGEQSLMEELAQLHNELAEAQAKATEIVVKADAEDDKPPSLELEPVDMPVDTTLTETIDTSTPDDGVSTKTTVDNAQNEASSELKGEQVEEMPSTEDEKHVEEHPRDEARDESNDLVPCELPFSVGELSTRNADEERHSDSVAPNDIVPLDEIDAENSPDAIMNVSSDIQQNESDPNDETDSQNDDFVTAAPPEEICDFSEIPIRKQDEASGQNYTTELVDESITAAMTRRATDTQRELNAFDSVENTPPEEPSCSSRELSTEAVNSTDVTADQDQDAEVRSDRVATEEIFAPSTEVEIREEGESPLLYVSAGVVDDSTYVVQEDCVRDVVDESLEVLNAPDAVGELKDVDEALNLAEAVVVLEVTSSDVAGNGINDSAELRNVDIDTDEFKVAMSDLPGEEPISTESVASQDEPVREELYERLVQDTSVEQVEVRTKVGKGNCAEDTNAADNEAADVENPVQVAVSQTDISSTETKEIHISADEAVNETEESMEHIVSEFKGSQVKQSPPTSLEVIEESSLRECGEVTLAKKTGNISELSSLVSVCNDSVGPNETPELASMTLLLDAVFHANVAVEADCENAVQDQNTELHVDLLQSDHNAPVGEEIEETHEILAVEAKLPREVQEETIYSAQNMLDQTLIAEDETAAPRTKTLEACAANVLVALVEGTALPLVTSLLLASGTTSATVEELSPLAKIAVENDAIPATEAIVAVVEQDDASDVDVTDTRHDAGEVASNECDIAASTEIKSDIFVAVDEPATANAKTFETSVHEDECQTKNVAQVSLASLTLENVPPASTESSDAVAFVTKIFAERFVRELMELLDSTTLTSTNQEIDEAFTDANKTTEPDSSIQPEYHIEEAVVETSVLISTIDINGFVTDVVEDSPQIVDDSSVDDVAKDAIAEVFIPSQCFDLPVDEVMDTSGSLIRVFADTQPVEVAAEITVQEPHVGDDEHFPSTEQGGGFDEMSMRAIATDDSTQELVSDTLMIARDFVDTVESEALSSVLISLETEISLDDTKASREQDFESDSILESYKLTPEEQNENEFETPLAVATEVLVSDLEEQCRMEDKTSIFILLNAVDGDSISGSIDNAERHGTTNESEDSASNVEIAQLINECEESVENELLPVSATIGSMYMDDTEANALELGESMAAICDEFSTQKIVSDVTCLFTSQMIAEVLRRLSQCDDAARDESDAGESQTGVVNEDVSVIQDIRSLVNDIQPVEENCIVSALIGAESFTVTASEADNMAVDRNDMVNGDKDVDWLGLSDMNAIELTDVNGSKSHAKEVDLMNAAFATMEPSVEVANDISIQAPDPITDPSVPPNEVPEVVAVQVTEVDELATLEAEDSQSRDENLVKTGDTANDSEIKQYAAACLDSSLEDEELVAHLMLGSIVDSVVGVNPRNLVLCKVESESKPGGDAHELTVNENVAVSGKINPSPDEFILPGSLVLTDVSEVVADVCTSVERKLAPKHAGRTRSVHFADNTKNGSSDRLLTHPRRSVLLWQAPIDTACAKEALENSAKRRASRRRTSRRTLADLLAFPTELARFISSDTTLLAYDARHEQGEIFSLLDQSILTINPNGRHIHLDDSDERIGSKIIGKRKTLMQELHSKNLALRQIPRFNYMPMQIKFQWSDFVVATPVRPSSSNVGEEHVIKSPVEPMRSLQRKGAKLPCGSYVVVSAFIRPLEDGNENLHVQIYDAERVEEFQFDFSEDLIKKYHLETTGMENQSLEFLGHLEFRRDEDTIIIKLPQKKAGEGFKSDADRIQSERSMVTGGDPRKHDSLPKHGRMSDHRLKRSTAALTVANSSR